MRGVRVRTLCCRPFYRRFLSRQAGLHNPLWQNQNSDCFGISAHFRFCSAILRIWGKQALFLTPRQIDYYRLVVHRRQKFFNYIFCLEFKARGANARMTAEGFAFDNRLVDYKLNFVVLIIHQAMPLQKILWQEYSYKKYRQEKRSHIP